MSVPRFFVATTLRSGLDFVFEPEDAHHAASVLRLRAGDRIVAIDAAGAWTAELTAVTKKGVRARAIAPSGETSGELPVEVTVLQAIAKGSKLDDAVEKTIELGARRIVPVRCARSYADATSVKVERWRRIARAAAAQSRRRVLPHVDEPADWADAIARFAPAMPVVVAWELAPKGSIGQAVQRCREASAIAIAVGPEGSFTDDEIQCAREAGCNFVSLGPTILRTETAAAALLAAIASGCGWW
jgi:16S rRNA (uracil1498-N3)-methyltransferase